MSIKSNVFSQSEMMRYSRQIQLNEIGIEGQKKLRHARVLCVGVGGLGTPLAMYLAAMGVGTLGLVDDETIELSNLHRQILYRTTDVGRLKVIVAKEQLQSLNPEVNIHTHQERLTRENATLMIDHYDFIADCTDDFYTKYVLNDFCYLLKKPLVMASIYHFQGQYMQFAGGMGPCYRCYFPEPPGIDEIPSCDASGVIGVLPGILGTLQANEIVKSILSIGERLMNRLWVVDTLATQFKTYEMSQNPECALCVKHLSLDKLRYPNHAGCEAVQANDELNPDSVKKMFATHRDICLLDVRSEHERQIKHIGGDHIPLENLNSSLNKLDRDKTIIIYCQTGIRSQRAVSILKKSGFLKVFSLKGGIEVW